MRVRCEQVGTIYMSFRIFVAFEPNGPRQPELKAALELANDTEFGSCPEICATSLKYATRFKRHYRSREQTMSGVTGAGLFALPLA